MGNTYIADPVGKESTTEAEAAVILELNEKKAKIFTKFGSCQPEERTLDQWFCTLLNGSMPTNDCEDWHRLQNVGIIARCIFPINESDYAALSLQERLQIVMGMKDWATDLIVGSRYHNDRDQFYGKMQEIMPNWTEDDVARYKKEDSANIIERFHEYANACCRNRVELDELTFTKRLMFNSFTDLAVYLLIYYVENDWRIQQCPICECFYRSPSLKRETCSEECKKENERRKKKSLSEVDQNYKNAKSNFDRKYSLSKKREGMYFGRDSLKEEFAEFLQLNAKEREKLNMASNVFDDHNLSDIREWLKRRRVAVKQAERRQKREGVNGEISTSYEDFVLKFRELLSALEYDTEYNTKDYYKEKEKML